MKVCLRIKMWFNLPHYTELITSILNKNLFRICSVVAGCWRLFDYILSSCSRCNMMMHPRAFISIVDNITSWNSKNAEKNKLWGFFFGFKFINSADWNSKFVYISYTSDVSTGETHISRKRMNSLHKYLLVVVLSMRDL